jgi:hypothetical protein
MIEVIGMNIRTFTITGTGLTRASIGGFPYLNDGLVDQITIADSGSTSCSFTSLGLAGSVLGNAMREDREGTKDAALENLRCGLTDTLNGTNGNNSHLPGGSAKGPTIAPLNGTRYNLLGNDEVVPAASHRTTAFLGAVAMTAFLAAAGPPT